MPENVTVERFVPQAEVLPRCGAVVCHGGSGTVLARARPRAPVALSAAGSDQFANASNLEHVGAGISLVGADVTHDGVRSALDQRWERAPTVRSTSLAKEIAAMPGESDVARAVEDHAVVAESPLTSA